MERQAPSKAGAGIRAFGTPTPRIPNPKPRIPNPGSRIPDQLPSAARTVAIAFFVTLAEAGPIVIPVRVLRAVRSRVALIRFTVVLVAHRVVAVAIAAVIETLLESIAVASGV